MKKYLLDTNVILRFLLQDNNKYYQIALNYFKKAQQKQIVLEIIPEVLFELDYVLRGVYHLSKNKVVDILSNLLKTPYLMIENRELMLTVVEKYQRINIDLFDLYLFYIAKYKKSEVLSFDEDFQKL
ncbi:MAG: PIN domain-containing protein [Candidatus Omnitrophica bacterium]|nr:PIN domain-containing protein [Candidatus Omnitrophota bacterium]